MDENSTRLLQYGHLGKAIYETDTQSWSFSRTLAPAPRITFTGVTKTTVQSPITSTQPSSTVKKKTLSKRYPELIAGFPFARNETLSNIVTTTNEACSPLVSSLLAFGRAVDLGASTSGRRAVPIAAFASGECGNTISFRAVNDDTVELQTDPTVLLRVPTIGDADIVEWRTDGAPIRQICFSRAFEERATLMAARLECSTAIFRPLYRRSPVPVIVHRDSNDVPLNSYRSSRLDPNFLVEIPISRRGDPAHADVRFNPLNQKQLAIVDEGGNWSIWELHSRHKRNNDNWIAECITSGSLPWVGVEDVQEPGSDRRHDGWLVIEWVGDHNIIVCDRKCSMLYRIEDGQVYSFSVELGFKKKSEWILDIKKSTYNSSHIFILTTSRLFWLDVTPDSIPVRDDSRPSLYPRLAWRHFRDSDDTTLQLASLAVEEDFYLFLFSRLNRLVLAYYCPDPSKHLSDSMAAPDPFILHIPPSSDHAGDSEIPSSAPHFSTLIFKEIAHSPSDLGKHYYDPTLRLLKVFAIDSHLSVQETLYSRPSDGNSGRERSHGPDVLRVKYLHASGQRTQATHSWSDFIVDDWDESELGADTVSEPVNDSIAPLAVRQKTLDYTQIYAIAVGNLSLGQSDGQQTFERNFCESVKQLADGINESNPGDEPTSRTALEILQTTPVLDDIDQNAQDLAAFVSQFAARGSAFGDRSHFIVQPLNPLSSPLSQQFKSAEPQKLDLVTIYDRLVNAWLVDLPSDTPGRARIAKEKAIRSFATDLALAQVVSVRNSTRSESDEQLSKTDGVSSLSSRGLIAAPSTASDRSLFEPLTIRGPGPWSQHSTTATQSSSALGDHISQSQSETCATFTALSSYTVFERKEPISRDVERILDHWKPGNSPATYSLTSETSRSLARPSKRKSRKKMPLSQPMSVDSFIPPPVSSPVPAVREWGSQPENNQPPMIRLQSSQVTEDLPMTQVERGAFGGREARKNIKAKKKKRAAGF